MGGGERCERIKKALVFASCNGASFNTEFFHYPGKTKAVHNNADRPHDAGLIDIDLIGSGCHVIPARSADILDHHVERDIRILGSQAFDFVIDIAGLHRTATGTIDSQYDALGIGIAKGRL